MQYNTSFVLCPLFNIDQSFIWSVISYLFFEMLPEVLFHVGHHTDPTHPSRDGTRFLCHQGKRVSGRHVSISCAETSDINNNRLVSGVMS
jgi:hypothetical protein